MQNVVNYKTSFKDKNGQTIVKGRVRFVSPKSDDEFIVIKDFDGNPLKNPLPLNDKGEFLHQPFVDDGIDYKMIVEKDTSIPAPYGSEDATIFEKVDEIHSFYERVSVEIGGDITSVDSIEDLRKLDTKVGKALVLGYNYATDSCPMRVFVFKKENIAENYGTQIKVDGGTWIYNSDYPIDARCFGLFPNMESDCYGLLEKAFNGSKSSVVKSLYIPSGTYRISKSFDFTGVNVVLEKGVSFEKVGDLQTIYITLLDYVDYGCTFGNGVFPKFMSGTLYTSSIGSMLSEYFANNSVYEKVDRIVFDRVNDAGTREAFVNDKTIISIADIPANIKPVNCVVFKDGNLSLQNGRTLYEVKFSPSGIEVFTMGKGTKITPAGIDTQGNINANGKVIAKGNIETNENLAVIKDIVCSGKVKNYALRNEWVAYVSENATGSSYVPLPHSLAEGYYLRITANANGTPQENSIGFLKDGNWIFPKFEWTSKGNNLYSCTVVIDNDLKGAVEVKSSIALTITQNYS